ncbi:MAG: hypothetical protein JW876_04695 [Candidatus Krumholzibacteriota bacterium]|nr:hypothetical protein [Candidatus Krumholzibacteriota bacterium]
MAVTGTYAEIGERASAEPRRTYFYMMNNLLYSRLESGFPSNEDCYDEDVNVYIAALLAGLVDGPGQQRIASRMVPWDIALSETARSIEHPRGRYDLYRANADFLLLSIGIFDNPTGRRPSSTPWLCANPRLYAGRGAAYYAIARGYAIETFRRPTAISDVLGKLADGFEKYAHVLSRLRSEYFNLYRRLTGGEIYHLGRDVDRIDDRARLGELHDRFLDLYSARRTRPAPEIDRDLLAVVDEIRSIDPTFSFSME